MKYALRNGAIVGPNDLHIKAFTSKERNELVRELNSLEREAHDFSERWTESVEENTRLRACLQDIADTMGVGDRARKQVIRIEEILDRYSSNRGKDCLPDNGELITEVKSDRMRSNLTHERLDAMVERTRGVFSAKDPNPQQIPVERSASDVFQNGSSCEILDYLQSLIKDTVLGCALKHGAQPVSTEELSLWSEVGIRDVILDELKKQLKPGGRLHKSHW